MRLTIERVKRSGFWRCLNHQGKLLEARSARGVMKVLDSLSVLFIYLDLLYEVWCVCYLYGWLFWTSDISVLWAMSARNRYRTVTASIWNPFSPYTYLQIVRTTGSTYRGHLNRARPSPTLLVICVVAAHPTLPISAQQSLDNSSRLYLINDWLSQLCYTPNIAIPQSRKTVTVTVFWSSSMTK
jgi:hypothetical protein